MSGLGIKPITFRADTRRFRSVVVGDAAADPSLAADPSAKVDQHGVVRPGLARPVCVNRLAAGRSVVARRDGQGLLALGYGKGVLVRVAVVDAAAGAALEHHHRVPVAVGPDATAQLADRIRRALWTPYPARRFEDPRQGHLERLAPAQRRRRRRGREARQRSRLSPPGRVCRQLQTRAAPDPEPGRGRLTRDRRHQPEPVGGCPTRTCRTGEALRRRFPPPAGIRRHQLGRRWNPALLRCE